MAGQAVNEGSVENGDRTRQRLPGNGIHSDGYECRYVFNAANDYTRGLSKPPLPIQKGIRGNSSH